MNKYAIPYIFITLLLIPICTLPMNGKNKFLSNPSTHQAPVYRIHTQNCKLVPFSKTPPPIQIIRPIPTQATVENANKKRPNPYKNINENNAKKFKPTPITKNDTTKERQKKLSGKTSNTYNDKRQLLNQQLLLLTNELTQVAALQAAIDEIIYLRAENALLQTEVNYYLENEAQSNIYQNPNNDIIENNRPLINDPISYLPVFQNTQETNQNKSYNYGLR